METPNLNYIKELSENDLEYMGAFIKILKSEFPIEKEQYLANIQNNNTAEAALNVHKLKHKMNILGLEEGYTLTVKYEAQLRKGQTDLKDDFLKILISIQEFLENIPEMYQNY